jgi:hypothetical protein
VYTVHEVFLGEMLIADSLDLPLFLTNFVRFFLDKQIRTRVQSKLEFVGETAPGLGLLCLSVLAA